MGEQTPKEKDAPKGVLNTLKNAFITDFPSDFSHKEGRADVIRVAWPAFIELFLMQLASMVSTMMVGGLGTWAIAAVGFSGQLRLLAIAVFMAFNTGSTALIARAKGAKDPELANKVMHQTILFSMSISIVVAVLGTVFATPLVIMMGAADELTIAGATRYVQVIMMTFPANAFSMGVTAMLRGIGRTRVSMVYNIAANVTNVILGLLLIQGNLGFPALGVTGAAIALGGGQIIAAIMAFFTIRKGADILKLSFKKLMTVDFSMFQRVSKIGTPAMFEQLFMRFGNIMFFRIIASLGTDAFATHQIVLNIHMMTFMTGQAFGISATSLLGQSMGKKRPDIGKGLVFLCRKYSLLVSMALVTGILIFRVPLVSLYTYDEYVIAAAVTILWVIAAIQPFQSSQQVLAGALRGAGDTKAVAVCIFIGIVIVRPVMAYVTVTFTDFGVFGIWIAMFLDQVARSGYVMWRFISEKWKGIRV